MRPFVQGLLLDNASCKLYFQDMTGRELVKRLKDAGWKETSIRGSQHKFEKDGRTVIVPVHGNRDVPTGTLHAILKQAGLEG